MFTKIKCMDGTIERADISKMEFIPNGMYREFEKLMPKNGEETCNVLRSCKYHTQKEYISKEQTEEFKYPENLTNDTMELVRHMINKHPTNEPEDTVTYIPRNLTTNCETRINRKRNRRRENI